MRKAVLLLLLTAVPAVAGSSASLLDLSADGQRLLVANTDSGTVSVVDVAARTLVCELPAGDHPEGTAWAGPVGLVTVYGDDRLLFLDPAAKKITHVLPVDDEPYGVVTTRDGRRAFVSHDYPGTVSEIDVPGRKVLRTFQVGENCRGLALSHDERTLFVTEFFRSKLLAVDIASGKVTDQWPGYESDNLCRHVALHPTRPKAYLSHLRSRVNQFDARASIFPRLSFCDLWTRTDGEKRRRAVELDTYNGVLVTANPWESALSPDGKLLYILYAGTDDANVSRVIDDDYRESEPVGRPVRLGKHPRAVRPHPNGQEVYVYNTLDFQVGVYSPDLRRKLGAVTVTQPPHSPAWVRGKELFVTARAPMGGTGWVSCSSCHPDGLTDARVWQNPEGHRRTPHLFGLAHTHPLHWSADRDEVQDFEYTVRGKLMRGRGLCREPLKPRDTFTDFAELEQTTSGLSADLDALAVYTNSFPVRLSPHELTPEAERGKALFFSAATKCATCHTGPYYTDSRLAKPYLRHDVGTGDHPAEKIGPRYDTPTLLGVYRCGPYLHDGRAKTLADVLTTCNPNDTHGKTSHLTPVQVSELVAFLKALPYEPPPEETPNTVKHRTKLTYPRPTAGGG